MLGTDEEYIGLVDAIISACYENVPDQSSILKIPYIQVFQSNQHQDGSLSYIGALHEYEYRTDDLNKGIVDVGVKILFLLQIQEMPEVTVRYFRNKSSEILLPYIQSSKI